MIRVLQVLASLEGSGGVQKRLIDNYLNMNRDEVKFDFIVHGYDSSELEPLVKKMGCNVYHVARKRGFGLLKNILDINRVIADGNYDIVQSHMERAGAIVLPLAKIHGVKVCIAHSHLAHIYSTGIIKQTKKVLTAIINKTATDFWACSREAGVWLFGKKVGNSSNLRIIPNAIDVSKFRFNPEKRIMSRRELGLQEDEFAIVNVGRLSYQKNHIFLFEVFVEILKIEKKAKLYLIGDGELKDELIVRVKELGLEGSVVFMGSRNDVYDLLQAMDLMAHPAFFEGLGNVLIEAQAAGLPIVAANEGIPKETNITQIIKYVSLNMSAYQWAQECITQLNIPRKDTSQKVIEAKFDCNTQGHALQRLYEELLQLRRNA